MRHIPPKIVWNELKSRRGRQRGIHGRPLARAIGAPYREVRKAIESLILAGKPIGADPQAGYYVIARSAEFLTARRELRTRISALSRRLEALDEACSCARIK